MIKKLIAPLQKMLMQKKMCPACTRPLNKAKVINKVKEGNVLQCNCGRIFVMNSDTGIFRRALDEDLTNNDKKVL
jgi:hypothetical protein